MTGSSSDGQPDLLEPLGQAADRDVVDTELVEGALGRRDLRRAAVDDHQPGGVRELARAAGLGVDQHRTVLGVHRVAAGLLVEQAAEPAGDHLVHGRDVVLAVDALDHEPAVLALAGQAVLEDDHRRDHLGALEVGDVVALDPQRHVLEAERLLDLLQRAVAGGQVAGALGLVQGQRLLGVAGDGLLEGLLVARAAAPGPTPCSPAGRRRAARRSRVGRQRRAPGSRAGWCRGRRRTAGAGSPRPARGCRPRRPDRRPSRAGRGSGRPGRGRSARPPRAGPRRARSRRRRCRRRSTTACFSSAFRIAPRSSRSRAAFS